jgi:hypothetical protein
MNRGPMPWHAAQPRPTDTQRTTPTDGLRALGPTPRRPSATQASDRTERDLQLTMKHNAALG